MPKTNAYSRDNILESIGILDLHISWLNQPVLDTSDVTFNSINVTEDVVIGGDLTVNGAATIISSTIVEIEDNIILINAEETGAGITLNLAGIEVERGTLANFQSVYEESSDLYKIGEVGSLQAVATREDLPLDKGVMVFNDILNRIDSVTDIELPITFSGGVNSTDSISGTVIISNGGGLGVTGDIYTDNKIFIKGNDYSSFIDVNNSNELIANSGTNFIFQQFGGSQIKIPTDVFLTFGSISQRINSDGSSVNIVNLGGNINLTTVTSGSIVLPTNTYLEWTSSNKIRYDGANIVLDSSGDFTINPPINSVNTTPSLSSVTGSVKILGGIGISNTTDAISSTNGGTITTSGGVAIRKQLYIGDTLNIGDIDITKTQISSEGINFRSINRQLTTSSTSDTMFNTFEGGVISLSSGNITNAATLYISDSPSIISGGTLTNTYSLWVDNGISRFDGVINSVNTTVSSSPISGSVILSGSIGISNTTDSISSLNGGTITSSGGIGVGKSIYIGNTVNIGDTSITLNHINEQGINLRSMDRTITTTSTDNLMFNTFEGGNINTSNTISTAATVYIKDSPIISSGGGTITTPYSLWVNSGVTRLDGLILVNDNSATTSPTTGAIKLVGGIGIDNSTDAVNEDNGGTFTTAGGVAIKKKLFVGNEITSNNGTNNSHYRLFTSNLHRFTLGLNGIESGSNSGSDFVLTRYNDLGNIIDNTLTINRDTGNIISLSTTASISNSSGAMTLDGGIGISNTTNSVDITNGGTFTTAGGASIAKDLYIGGNSYVITNFDVDGLTTLDQTTINTTDGEFNISGTNGISMIVNNTSIFRTTSGSLTLDSNNGTLIIEGETGVTIDSNSGISIDASNVSNFSTTVGSITISSIGLNLYGNSDNVNITNTSLINISSGTGGIDINTTDTASGINIGIVNPNVPITIGHSSSETTIGDNLTVTGDLTVLGTTTTIKASILTIDDNALIVNASPTGTSDGGFLIRRYQTPNDISSGEVVNGTPFISSTFQIGSSTPSTLVLNSGESSVNDFYIGWWIKITSGAGSSQVRRIKTYNGTTKIATLYITSDNTSTFIDGLDLTIAPSSGDSYELYDCSFASIYFSESSNEIKFACIPFDIGTGTFNSPTTYLPIHADSLTIENGFTAGGDTTINGKLLIEHTDTQALNVRKDGDTGDVFTVDSTNGNIILSNPINTISSDITLLFKQYNSINISETYSQINSTIFNNVAGNLRNTLSFDVQKDTSGLVTYLSLIGDVSGSGFADFTTSVDAVRILNTTASTSNSTGSLRISGGIGISNTTDATSSTNGGTITTAGGVGIAKKLFVGTDLTVGGILDSTNTTASISNSTGAVTLDGGIGISNITDATSSTNGGTITTAGGVGIAKKLFVGTDLAVGGTSTLTGIFDSINTTASTSNSTGAVTLDGGIGISNITDATSSTNGGTITTAGGVGIAKKLFVGTDLTVGGILDSTNTIASTSNSTGSLRISGGIGISNITDATSSINGGTITTAGGVSIAKKLFVGGNTVIGDSLPIDGSRSLTISNTSTGINAFSILSLDTDNVSSAAIFLNSSNRTIDGGINTCTFRNDAGDLRLQSASNKGIVIASSSGNIILDSTTVSTSNSIGGLTLQGGIAIANTTDAINSTNGGTITTAGGVAIAKKLFVGTDLTVGGILDSTNTTTSISNSTGSVTLDGGIGISNTTDATNGTNGGTFTTAGGAAFAKSVFIGNTSGSFLALDFNQRYDLIGNVSGNLNIQSRTSSVAHSQRHFTEDGDNTDSNIIEIFGLGIPSNTVNSESIKFGFEPTQYILKTQASGTGVVRQFNIETGSNSGQLQLLTGGQVSLSSTEPSTSSISGSLRTTGGIAISNTTNATSSTNGGTFTTAGGAAIAKDLYVGGAISAGISTPSFTISNEVNITGLVIVNTEKLISNGGERVLSNIFRITPTSSSIVTSFEFTIPDITSFTNIYDIVININGFHTDGDPLSIENIIGFAITGTNRCKIKFTSSNTSIHTLHVISRYTSN